MSRKCLPLGHFLVLKRLLGRSASSGDALLALRMLNTVCSAAPPSSLSNLTNHFIYFLLLAKYLYYYPKICFNTFSYSLNIPANFLNFVVILQKNSKNACNFEKNRYNRY